MRRYCVTVQHGEGRSVWHVVDCLAPEDEQPAIVSSHATRIGADMEIAALDEVLEVLPEVPKGWDYV